MKLVDIVNIIYLAYRWRQTILSHKNSKFKKNLCLCSVKIIVPAIHKKKIITIMKIQNENVFDVLIMRKVDKNQMWIINDFGYSPVKYCTEVLGIQKIFFISPSQC